MRILLVDDYVDSLEMWALYLRHCGYEVATATDGPSALEHVAQARPDLIVLDVNLPGLSGFEVGRRLRATPETSSIPIVAATGHVSTAQNDTAFAVFDAVLVKPCEPAVLVGTIQRFALRPDGV